MILTIRSNQMSQAVSREMVGMAAEKRSDESIGRLASADHR